MHVNAFQDQEDFMSCLESLGSEDAAVAEKAAVFVKVSDVDPRHSYL